MDLLNLIPESDTIVIELIHKDRALLNDDGTPMTIEAYLPHSKEYKAVRHKQADFIISKGEEKLKSSEYEDLGLNFLSEITKGWDITYGEEKPKFTKKKAREVYQTLPFIPELVRKEVEESEAFI